MSFRRFTIHQSMGHGMKVSVDAVCFGLIVGREVASERQRPAPPPPPVAAPLRVLDIGTGTGLLALQLAQLLGPRAAIEAIDVDATAAAQAAANAAASEFAAQIEVMLAHTSR
jgi:methylase of polypeptide subunit release factors